MTDKTSPAREFAPSSMTIAVETGTQPRAGEAMLMDGIEPSSSNVRRDNAPKRLYEANKLAKRLRRQVGEAIADYEMIAAGDRVMVCLSGGKDSYGLLDVLLSLRAHAPVDF